MGKPPQKTISPSPTHCLTGSNRGREGLTSPKSLGEFSGMFYGER